MSGVSLAWCVVYPWRPPIADCNCSESKSPSSHAFHPNHHQFLLPPYRNLCCNSDPSSLIYSPQRRNRMFPSSAIASYRLQCFPWLFRRWCFLTKILSIHSVLCHRSCFPHWTFPCALPEMQLLTRSALCRTPYTPAVQVQTLHLSDGLWSVTIHYNKIFAFFPYGIPTHMLVLMHRHVLHPFLQNGLGLYPLSYSPILLMCNT